MITIVFMYAVLAATFTVGKIVAGLATPYFIVGFRMTVAGIFFLAYQYLRNKKQLKIKTKDLGLFFYTALFYIYLAYIPEFWALQYVSSSKEVILYSITPFIVAILAYFLASEKITIKKIIGMIIGFIGMMPMLLMQDDIREASMELFKISWPEVVLMIAIFSGAYGWFPVKKLMNKGYSLASINGYTMFTGGIGAFITSFAVDGFFHKHVFDWLPFLFWIIILIITANGIFYTLYGWHLSRFSFTLLSFFGFLCPIFGSFYAWRFLGDQLTLNHLVALILTSLGLYIFYKDELKKA